MDSKNINHASPRPWRISDAHGLCIADRNNEIVADLTPRNDWSKPISHEILRANADLIVTAVNDFENDYLVDRRE